MFIIKLFNLNITGFAAVSFPYHPDNPSTTGARSNKIILIFHFVKL